MADVKIVTSDFLDLFISTSKNNDVSLSTKRFSKKNTISNFKAKLELITGGCYSTMQLQVFDKDNKPVCNLDDDNALLGSYPIDDGMRLHVIDKFLLQSEYEVDDAKFELSAEDYAQKTDTVRAYLLKNKLGHYNEDYCKKKEKMLEDEKKLAENTPIGSRCKVTVQNAPCRLGTVMYSGSVETLPGYWIGVKYDEPLGKHNGTFKEKRYFECPDKYGAFVKPHTVECGDFPEEKYDLDEEI